MTIIGNNNNPVYNNPFKEVQKKETPPLKSESNVEKKQLSKNEFQEISKNVTGSERSLSKVLSQVSPQKDIEKIKTFSLSKPMILSNEEKTNLATFIDNAEKMLEQHIKNN